MKSASMVDVGRPETKTEQREMLRRMLRIRLFEEQAAREKATHIPGSLHNSIGQEAAIVGACMALREDDFITGTHRSHGHPIGKGVALAPLMAELFGKSTGICRGKGGSMHLAACSAGSLGESGIVGASMPAAVGAALSALMRGSDQVSVSFFGDGAANCGPFHESLNLAAVWRLPVVFFCENNGYAICSAQRRTTAVADIATRAVAYDMPGAVVDGQDVIAVHRVVKAAVARARAGEGPSLVEAKTYRFCEHQEVEFEFPKYRPEDELACWKTRDPIELFRKILAESNALTRGEWREMMSAVQREVDAAVTFARDSEFPHSEALLEDLFG